jgi:outer membrane protein assembly factor BamB
VWTSRYDNARTGSQTAETVLTPANVSQLDRFGLLFSRPVDGTIQAQPLYAPGLAINGATHNVVFVATENDSVYAFDADDPAQNAPLWKTSLGMPVPSDPSSADPPPWNCADLIPISGISATPVIDAPSGTIYVIAETLEGGAHHHKLHALDWTNGAEKSGSPVDIAPTDGTIAFDPVFQFSRVGLLLDNGVVYSAFASHCDGARPMPPAPAMDAGAVDAGSLEAGATEAGAPEAGAADAAAGPPPAPYYGWVLAHDARTLAPKGVFRTGLSGGIWQSGMGLSADGKGSVYFVSGVSKAAQAGCSSTDLCQSVGQLTLAGGGLSLVHSYTRPLFGNDLDLSTALVLGSQFGFASGKDGVIHVLDPTNMQSVQEMVVYPPAASASTATGGKGHVHGGPVYWEGPNGPLLYVFPEQGVLQVFSVTPGAGPLVPLATSAARSPSHPGAVTTISSNGKTPGTGILWAVTQYMDGVDTWHKIFPGTLYAIDAEDITKVLWTSDQNPAYAMGLFSKFCPPMVANGKVYMGTATTTNALRVYGLRN